MRRRASPKCADAVIKIVWRLLCLLVATSALAAALGLWPLLPVLLQAVLLGACALVTLLCAVAWWADSSAGSESSPLASTHGSNTDEPGQ